MVKMPLIPIPLSWTLQALKANRYLNNFLPKNTAKCFDFWAYIMQLKLLYTFPINPAVGREVSQICWLNPKHSRILDRESVSGRATLQVSNPVHSSAAASLRAPSKHWSPARPPHPAAVKVTHPQPKAATALSVRRPWPKVTHMCVRTARTPGEYFKFRAAQEHNLCLSLYLYRPVECSGCGGELWAGGVRRFVLAISR